MFKVKCTLIAFVGDEKNFPCHFHYKLGDVFYYDGVEFTGRVCPGLLSSMMPAIRGVYYLGYKNTENIMYNYRGIDAIDPSMAKYDGVGLRPVKTPPPGAPEKMVQAIKNKPTTQKIKSGGHFVCGDTRTLAEFTCEPCDLSDSDYAQPFYRRAIAILEKVEKEPGIKVADIVSRFTDFEREEISPPLTPILMEILMEALTDMKYIDVRDDKAYATGRQPPSRPKIG